MKYKFLIAGGDFNETNGRLTWVSLDLNTNQFTLLKDEIVKHPNPKTAQSGKGLTGLVVDKESIWMCFSDVIISRYLHEQNFNKVIYHDDFTDLHQLEMCEKGILISNTGNESIDTLSLKDFHIEQRNFLSEELRGNRNRVCVDKDKKPHLYHISSACLNEKSELIVGFGRQNRVMNIDQWSWVSPFMKSLVHDVQMTKDHRIWWTSIDGEVYSSFKGDSKKVFDLKEHQSSVGWTRGLAITSRGVLVGTTALRDSNSGYFHSRTRLDNVENRSSCITWLPFDASEPVVMMEMPDGNTRKIFTIRCLNDDIKP